MMLEFGWGMLRSKRSHEAGNKSGNKPVETSGKEGQLLALSEKKFARRMRC